MAAPYNPPVRGQDFTTYIALRQANNGDFKVNPTIAAGDFKVKKDSGAPANLATLPSVDAAGEIWVKIPLSATEMTADNVCIQCIDLSSPKEWADYCFTIVTT